MNNKKTPINFGVIIAQEINGAGDGNRTRITTLAR